MTRLSTPKRGLTPFSRLLVVACLATAYPAAQSKPPVPPSEYARWESLVAQTRATSTGPLSPDGRYLVYGINRQNRDDELRVVAVGEGKTTVIPLGQQPLFSADSKWLAYAVGVTEAEEQKLQKARKQVRRKLGIVELATGTTTTIDEIESFAFSGDGRYLAMQVYAPEPARPTGGAHLRRPIARSATRPVAP